MVTDVQSISLSASLINNTQWNDLFEEVDQIMPPARARFPVEMLEAFYNLFGNSAHLQIVGDRPAIGGVETSIEVEVLSGIPTWQVLWTEDGLPRSHANTSNYLVPGLYSRVSVDIGSREAQNVWDQIISVADAFQEESPPYGLVIQNSNTFAASVMWAVGIDVPALETELTTGLIDNLPGLGQNVVKNGIRDIVGQNKAVDLELIGDIDWSEDAVLPDGAPDTPDNDIFNGGLGNDEIYGGAGNDLLSGGRGADVIEGGDGNDRIALDDQHYILNQTTLLIEQRGNVDVHDGREDIVIIDHDSGTDTITSGGPEDRIVFRLNDTEGLVLLGGLRESDALPQPPDSSDRARFGWGGTELDGWIVDGESMDGKVRRVGVDYDLDGSELTITIGSYAKEEGIDGDEVELFDTTSQLIIEDFEDGDFGITFTHAEVVEINPGYNDPDFGWIPPTYRNVRPDGWEASHDNGGQRWTLPDPPAEPYEPDYSGADDDSGVAPPSTPATEGPDGITTESIPDRFIDALGGDDTVVGSDESDVILGNDGNDTITGEDNIDWLDGGDGDDDLSGGLSDDFLVGGLGDDVIDGGEGIDTAFYSPRNGIAVDLAILIQQEVTFGEFDTLLNIENLIASLGDDTVFGDALPNYIFGAAGNDTLDGRDGDDVLEGGEGDDTLSGGTGDDTLAGSVGDDALDGGTGSDIYYWETGDGNDTINESANASETDTVRFGSGILPAAIALSQVGQDLRIDIGNEGVLVADHFGGAGVEAIEFEDGTVWDVADILANTIPDATNTVTGTEGNDTLVGTDGDDIMLGLGGQDTFFSSLGDDTFDGGDPGYNQVDYDGVPGDYTFTLNGDGSVTVDNPTYGTDTLIDIDGVWFRGEPGWYALDTLIQGTSGTILGTQGDDYLTGTAGDDVFDGLGGLDTFYGGLGNDTYYGGDPGYNQVDYNGFAADYTFTRNGDDSVTVSHPTYGTDTLIDIGGFWFTDEAAWYAIETLAPVDTGWAGQDDTVATPADTSVALYLLANDTIPTDANFAHFIWDQPDHGTVVWDWGQFSYIYTPDPGFTGTDTLTYGLHDQDNGNEVMTPSGMTVTIEVGGNPGHTAYVGTGFSDTFTGTGNDDVIHFNGGTNKSADGAGGTGDRIIFDEAVADYTIIGDNDDYTVVHTPTGDSIEFTNVEYLEFADSNMVSMADIIANANYNPGDTWFNPEPIGGLI